MAKANKNDTYIEPTEYKTPEQEAVEKERFVTSEKLQTFYNEAYINERDRLNAMFGRLDTYPVVEEKIVYRDPDLTNYVHISQYKKKKSAATALGILFGIAAAAAVVLAILLVLKPF